MLKNEHIDCGKEFVWGLASADYAKYRDIYPNEFYNKIVDLGYCKDGQRVLDLATGTGVLPRNMYKYGAEWIGTDISENQIKFARELSRGLDINYIISSAENLDFPENSFDVITACQCFMYFNQSVLFPKAYKWLKPNGHFLIMFMAWLPFESELAMESEKLVLKYNPSWSGRGMTRYEVTAPEMSKSLFDVANTVSFDIDLPFTRETWHGRIKACRGIGASNLNTEEILNWEKEHKKLLSRYPEHFTIPHYVTILDLKCRSNG